MNICRILICWALIAFPVVFLTSCEEDHDDYDHNLKWGYTQCNLIADSSAGGLVTATYNNEEQITSYSTPGLSRNFTYQNDSVIVNTVTDSFSLREVVYGGYRDWQKSISTYRAPDKFMPGAVLKKITTCTQYRNDSNITSITSATTSSFILNGVETNLGTTTEVSTLSYNFEGCITKIVTVTKNDTSVYDFTYGGGGVIVNRILVQTCLSEALKCAATPALLGYYSPFLHDLIKIQGPDGSLTFSNYKWDANENLISYSMVGTGNMASKTGSVKSTFSCRDR